METWIISFAIGTLTTLVLGALASQLFRALAEIARWVFDTAKIFILVAIALGFSLLAFWGLIDILSMSH